MIKMQTFKKTQIKVMNMPVVELNDTVFEFVKNYSDLLFAYKGDLVYMKIPLDKNSVEEMIRDSKKELTDSEIKDILELIYVLLDSGVPKEEIWLEIIDG